MGNEELQEILLSAETLGDDCTMHKLCISAVDDVSIQITCDEYPAVTASRSEPVSAQDLYDALHFAKGAKYELLGLNSNGSMDESVYKDFFSLMRKIVLGLNQLEPNPLSSYEPTTGE